MSAFMKYASRAMPRLAVPTQQQTLFGNRRCTLLSSPFAALFRSKHTLKTHSGMKKRFRLTGNGKIKRSRSGNRHNTGYKSRRKSNNLNGVAYVTQCMSKKTKICMGVLGK